MVAALQELPSCLVLRVRGLEGKEEPSGSGVPCGPAGSVAESRLSATAS